MILKKKFSYRQMNPKMVLILYIEGTPYSVSILPFYRGQTVDKIK